MDREHWDKMLLHVRSCLPNEACGLLGGVKGSVRVVLPVTNELRSPIRFRMDPQEQLSAMQRIEASGLEMIGIFHSHVHGPEEPSKTDLEESFYPQAVFIIWFPHGSEWTCRAYRLVEGSSIEIPLVVDSE